MSRIASTLVVLAVLTGVISGCATTPAPTDAAATQTPWIVVVTATPGKATDEDAQPTQTARVVVVTATLGPPAPAKAEPTQTPWIVVATPTAGAEPTDVPTKRPTLTPTTDTATATLIATATATATRAATKAIATETPTKTPTSVTLPPTDTPEAATPTLPPPTSTRLVASPTPGGATGAPGGQVYPPPVLREPTDGAQIEWDWPTVVFEWDDAGELAADEYYRVTIDVPAQPDVWAGYSDWFLTRLPTFTWTGPSKAPFHPPAGAGAVPGSWWVTIVRKTGEDENGQAVVEEKSAPSQRWTLFLHPRR